MGWRTSVGATVTTVAVLLGGYLVADAYDVVPGMLTTDPAPSAPAPFPSAPGATTGPPVERTLPDLPDDAPVPAEPKVGDLVTDLTDARLGKRVGALVADAASGDQLASAAPDRLMTPASTQKVLTAVAALAGPGGDTTLPTTAMLDGEDHLYLVGGGDMMLAAGSGDEDSTMGRAGLGDLADQVAEQLTEQAEGQAEGRTTVTLHLDDTLFTGPAVAASVPDDDVADGFLAPVAPLAVEVGAVPSDADAKYPRREKDPAQAAAKRFAAALEDRGITVRGSIGRTATPDAAHEVGRVESAPLADVVTYLLQHSDNTLTEVVGRVVALDAGEPGSLEGARTAVTAAVGELGVDLDGAVLEDMSGLARGSELTVRQLADTLALTVDPEHPELRVVARGLPVGGLSGTLADRYPRGDAGRGYVSGKTGSLPNVRGLAGTVVTADDRLLVFVAIADKIPDKRVGGANDALDRFADRLAACGCS